jgi:hypothetical protein
MVAFLYYQGLKYAKKEGRTILRAVSVFFSIAGVRYVALVMISLMAVYSGATTLTDFEINLYIFRALSAGFLILGAIYFLYATLKQNPPNENGNMLEPIKRS